MYKKSIIAVELSELYTSNPTTNKPTNTEQLIDHCDKRIIREAYDHQNTMYIVPKKKKKLSPDVLHNCAWSSNPLEPFHAMFPEGLHSTASSGLRFHNVESFLCFLKYNIKMFSEGSHTPNKLHNRPKFSCFLRA